MKTRSQTLKEASEYEFDLVVIGGGLNGSAIAQNASLRGLSVLLIEKEDFGSGSSSKTSQLLTSGSAYLGAPSKHFKNIWKEKEMLQHLAPHMVKEVSFITPLIKGHQLDGLKAQIGLTISDFAAWSQAGPPKPQKIKTQQVLESAPALLAKTIAAGIRRQDCLTNDSRLVIEVLKSALAHGAQAINYLEATGFQIRDDRVRAIECHDRYGGNEVLIRGKTFVNAAGVWSGSLLKMLDSDWQPTFTVKKRTHVVVPPSAFETNTALFLPIDDEICIFLMPWQRALLIGTTDSAYVGDIDRPLPTTAEIDDLLSGVNRYCGSSKLKPGHIIASWSGLFADLGWSDGSSIEHLIYDGPQGIVGLIGGGLASFRLLAAELVDRVVTKNPSLRQRPASTDRIMLGGFDDKNDFLTVTAAISAKARRLAIEPATLDHLIESYGKEAELVVDIVEKQPLLNRRVCPDFPHIMAEIPYCVLNEMAISLEDLLFRRMRLALLHQIQCRQAAGKVALLMQSLLEWDDARTNLELASLEKSLNEHLSSFATVPS